MLQNLSEIDVTGLIGAVAAKRAAGYRFVTVTCTDLGDAHDLLYQFDRELVLENLRVRLPKGAELPSISSEYFAAVLVENEIVDLFGIAITGLVLDYRGRFLLSEGSPRTPFERGATTAGPDDVAPHGTSSHG